MSEFAAQLPLTACHGDQTAMIGDGFLQVFSQSAGVIRSFCDRRFSEISALFFDQNGRFICIGERQKNIYIYDILLHKIISMIALPQAITNGAFCANGKMILITTDGQLLFVSFHAGVAEGSMRFTNAQCVSIAAGKKYAICGLSNGEAIAINIAQRQVVLRQKISDQPLITLNPPKTDIIYNEFDQYCADKTALENNIFLLLDDRFVQCWEDMYSSVYERVLMLFEQSDTAISRQIIEPFLFDGEKQIAYENALLISGKYSELKTAVREHNYDEVARLVRRYPQLGRSTSFGHYIQMVKNGFEQALAKLQAHDENGARKILAERICESTLTDTALLFSADFITALEYYASSDYKLFWQWCETHPICKLSPHFIELQTHIELLVETIEKHNSQLEFMQAAALYKELMQYAPINMPIVDQRTAIYIDFQTAINASQFDTAAALAGDHLFLVDTPEFMTLFSVYQPKISKIEKEAFLGQCEAVFWQTSKLAKSSIFAGIAQFYMRVAVTKEMISISLPNAVDWRQTIDSYCEVFGVDPFIQSVKAAHEIDIEFQPNRYPLNGYNERGFPRSCVSFLHICDDAPKRQIEIALAPVLIILLALFISWLLIARKTLEPAPPLPPEPTETIGG